MNSGKLYLVSTPIGNLEDITLRAIRILKEVDLIACEDTRHSKKLLNHYGIKTRLVSYHSHNEDKRSQFLLQTLLESKDVALISDAGTPVISDPGYRLVVRAVEKGIEVIPIPGPSSLLTALVVSALPSDRFCFYGFLPRGERKIKELAQKISQHTSTVILFESPKRILKSLSYLVEILGDRRAALCREMTKINEEVIRGTLEDIYRSLKERGDIKGEITLIIEGKGDNEDKNLSETLSIASNRLQELKGKDMTLKDAVKIVSKELNAPRKEIYKKALEIWDNSL